MKYQLASLILTILLAGTYALSCNYCIEGAYTVNGTKEEIPDQVKCKTPQKMNCSDSQVSCMTGTMTASLTKDGVNEFRDVQIRNCSEIRDGVAGCNAIRDENTKDGYTTNSFKCKIDVCSSDYCNSGSSPEISLMVGLLTVLAFLVGQ